MNTPDDRELRDAVEAGEEAFKDWRSREKRPVVSAAVIREFVIGGAAKSGVRLHGAEIVGLIDLVDARGESGACHALVLQDCVLQGDPDTSSAGEPGLDASHAHLQRLSLVGCQADGVELSSATIDGDLTLDELHPREGGACWVKARDVRVGGTVTAKRATLSVPWEPADEEAEPVAWPPDGARRWADVSAPFGFDLQGGRIDGSLLLRPGFASRGGVNIATATIGGDLWADGADLTMPGVGSGSGVALRAQSVEIRGHAMMTCDHGETDAVRRFKCRGTVDFLLAKVGGDFWLTGAELTGDQQTPALVLSSAALGGRVYLDEDYAAELPCAIPTMDLSGSTIGRALFIEASKSAPIQRVTATQLKVAGDLTLAGPVSSTDLSGSVIEGDLKLGFFYVPFELNTRCEDRPALTLVDACVGRALAIEPAIRTPGLPFFLGAAELCRVADLPCYPGWRLAEVFVPAGDTSDEAVLAFLHSPDDPDIVVLNGESMAIHRFNERRAPLLEREDQVAAYLSLFCNYVWGAEGPFAIVDRREEGNATVLEPIRDLHRAPDGSWRAVATVEYGSEQFKAEFKIAPSGEVEMPDDELLGEIERPPVLHDAPLRWVGRHVPPPAGLRFTNESQVPGEDGARDELRRLAARRRAKVDLRGLRAGSLRDEQGQNWGLGDAEVGDSPERLKLWLLLSGFEYARIDSGVDRRASDLDRARSNASDPTSRVRAIFGRAATEGEEPAEAVATLSPEEELAYRRNWLKAQYEEYPPTEADYRPQPYEQFAKVWRTAGHLAAADQIAFDKLRLEKVRLRLDPPRDSAPRSTLQRTRPFRHRIKQAATFLCVEVPFGFGLVLRRAAITFAVVYLVGFAAVSLVALKVDAQPVGTIVSGDGRSERVVVEVADLPGAPDEIDCGDQINRLVYPLDVMIPLIDLRQESRCQFSTSNGFLSAAKGIYAVVGWIVTSGLILTLSGVVRRRIES